MRQYKLSFSVLLFFFFVHSQIGVCQIVSASDVLTDDYEQLGNGARQLVAISGVISQSDFVSENTTYMLFGNCDLSNSVVKIPSGCVLDMSHGQFYNGKVFSDNKTTIINNPPAIIEGKNDSIFWGAFFDKYGYELTYKLERVTRDFDFLFPVVNQRYYSGRKIGTNRMNLLLDAIPNRKGLSCEYKNYSKSPLYRVSRFESVINQVRRYNCTLPMIRFTINNKYEDEPEKDPKTDLFSSLSDDGLALLCNYVEVTKREIDRYAELRDELQLEYIGVINEQFAMLDYEPYYRLLTDLSGYIRSKGFKSVLSNSLPAHGINNSFFNKDDFDYISFNHYPSYGTFNYGDSLYVDVRILNKSVSNVYYNPYGMLIKQNPDEDIMITECGILPYYERLESPWKSNPKNRIKDSSNEVVSHYYPYAIEVLQQLNHRIAFFSPWFVTYYDQNQENWMYHYFLNLRLNEH